MIIGRNNEKKLDEIRGKEKKNHILSPHIQIVQTKKGISKNQHKDTSPALLPQNPR